MNFFEQQAEARRQSWLFVALFALAIVAILVVLNLALCVVLVLLIDGSESMPGGTFGSWLWEKAWIFAFVTLSVLSTIGIASLYKISQLKAGGSAVAQSLDAVWISPSTTDFAQRRLLNVVQELSIAAGLPVPEVYLLEQETGINTFSAGHNPANAAIVVTQGALTRLNRAELQGVIAHELSHVLNGDMLLNIRLMGPLHGLMFISLTVRTILSLGFVAYPVLIAGSIVVVIGYMGLFFARTIQGAVSRRRELLADALAVQLTRDTSGLKSALVKVSALAFGSYLHHPQSEEVAHMLFAQGTIRSFETHPPLTDRINALDPTFREEEIEAIRRRLKANVNEVEINERLRPHRLDEWSTTLLTPAAVIDLVGHPTTEHLFLTYVILAQTPLAIVTAAEQPGSARALLLALALDFDASAEGTERRERQLRFISQQLDPSVASAVAALSDAVAKLDHEQRIPTLLRLFPSLRHLPFFEREQLLVCLSMMLQREGMSPYLYALRKLAQVQLADEIQPQGYRRALPLRRVRRELQVLFSVLAHHGNSHPLAVRRAYDAGMQRLFPKGAERYEFPISWPTELDRALDRLDQLAPTAKGQLVAALVEAISHDRRLLLGEAELLRAVCGSIHCPLPPLVNAAS